MNKVIHYIGLDVHLQFIMAVAQKDHANPHAPRKFTRKQLSGLSLLTLVD
jgi:hypothetical protein